MPKSNPSLSSSAGPTSARSSLIWWGVSALTILLGYADLWRGGETIAPILLVLGYCVLVPVAILKR
ncbi:MAG TPA: hypothetical protein VNU46_03770 [Gemmatimonadaceae bacterium]|nr:hypothetical protein [Gemmatimonadaceae bacterium]